MNGLPWDNNTWEVAAQIAARRARNVPSWMASTDTARTPLPLRDAAARAQLLMQAVIVPGARTSEGRLIEAVTIPWFEIVALLKDDPNVAFQIPADKWEEMVAGAYDRAGFDQVTLTPRSGDHGRDVI